MGCNKGHSLYPVCLGRRDIRGLLQPGTQAILDIHSQACEYTYLAIFDRTSNENWRYVDTMQIWSKLSDPKITLESLVEEGSKEIVASGCTVDSGTGVSQKDLVIFKLFERGLQVVFKEPELVVQRIGTGSKVSPQVDQSQNSEFKFAHPDEGEPKTSVRQIVEKQILKDHSLTIIRWRLYVWKPEIRGFEGIPTFPRTMSP